MSQNDPLELHTLQVFDYLKIEGIPPEGITLIDHLRIATNPTLKVKLIDDYMYWACGDRRQMMLEGQAYAPGIHPIHRRVDQLGYGPQNHQGHGSPR